MDDRGMSDLSFIGNPFTWCNGSRGRKRISTRLDKSDYNSLIESIWNKEVQGNDKWILQQKLKAIARGLSKWSKESIGDVFTSVKQTELEMCRLEQEYETNNDDANRQNLYKAQAEYTRWLNMQESILKQKSRIKSAEEGDSNSKYFHNVIKEKIRRAHIYRIKDNQGTWIEGNEATTSAAIDHFSNLFTHTQSDNNLSILECIEPMVTE
ncbi:uncharacterized protein [Nicotiana sylvestris]|uniref:Uncharacterized protein LOC104231465 n=1 Tax=Nicotiana sylvestris TaxID=4096 RepID=A0A1U7X8J5_NICSY|nr:PREDICTED: uncharacterized protein LOC104231465 [Nicotiana sylvestris]